jgi:membrane-bound lytic murein transglycosylase D
MTKTHHKIIIPVVLWLMLIFAGCAEWTIFPHKSPQKSAAPPEPDNTFSMSRSAKEGAELSKEGAGKPELSQVNPNQALQQEDKNQQLLDQALEFYQESQNLWAEGSSEEAIEALDRAYGLVLGVETNDGHKLLQQKEDLRFLICKRILEIYASRHTAVCGNYREIPLVWNSHVESEVKYFQTSERTSFLESYRRSGKYHSIILEELRKAGLPDELSWLPLIESGFRVRALSRARALGLWQFISSTGYKFGLKRNQWIDERMDTKKSTLAAIAYLTELHKMFGDWTTVLAAYNCGEVTVLRVIKNQKINYLDNFWDLYEKLPYETARFVPRFLAALHIIHDPERFGITLEEPDKPIAFEGIKINKQVKLKSIAKKTGISYELLASLNPELRRYVTPSEYTLKVPAGRGQLLLSKLDDIPRYRSPITTHAYHRVRRGETLSYLAKRYRTTVTAIARANNIRRTNFIREGQRLKIPVRR